MNGVEREQRVETSPHAATLFPNRYGRPILFRKSVTVNTFRIQGVAIHPSFQGA